MPSGDQAILLNLSDIDNGIYHLVLEADKVKYTTKIIKE
jgi:hypothetical protein